MKIEINGKSAGKEYIGAGMVSGNNSSRLLLDYKYEHPDRYNELLEHIFGRDGIGVVHLKLEMGADINSTSGTEPCVMRTADEKADVSRGAGYILAADAKRINPDITLDMLFWSEPKWVTDAEDVYAARYRWYIETLLAAYEAYGLVFDYVSVSRNEREIDGEWIKYFARHIKAERNRPYDFSAIKIVAADEENAWHIADIMLADEEVRAAVDVIGTHYTSHCTENARLLSEKYGKEIWFSEGSAPMTYARGVRRFDGSGLSGINGVLDIASRIAAMYPCGCMSLYEYQPAVSAYYDGVTFCHKQLITANEPWSGYYSLDSGYYMALHFSRFFRRGWRFIDSACLCDGEKGGDGHALVNTVHCFMTAADMETGDYSTVIINATDRELEYELHTENLGKSSSPVNIWEMRGPDGGEFDENYFRRAGAVIPENGCFTVKVKPYSMITLSTLDTEEVPVHKAESELLTLPYKDDFTYAEYGEDYLPSRGYAPRYTTDQGGAFEVKRINGENVLMQMITPETKAMEWGGTPEPTTNFGDDRWYDYEISADVGISESPAPHENYIGAGVRCSLACGGMNGYILLVYENGSWKFNRNKENVLCGNHLFDSRNVNIRISAQGEKVCGYINNERVFEYTEKGAVMGAGRAALYSSYSPNYFRSVEIKPIEGSTYITRYDDTDMCFEYSEGWEHKLMSGFADYRRTVSIGGAGEKCTLTFDGTGFGLFGANGGDNVISVSVDGVMICKSEALPSSGNRELYFTADGFESGTHRAEITVISGKLNIDGAQVI